MRLTGLERFFLRLDKRIGDTPNRYLRELVTQVEERADEEIERAVARGRVIRLDRVLDLVDALEKVASKVDEYRESGKIDSTEEHLLNIDIQRLKGRLQSYAFPKKDGPRDEGDGDVLVPV